MTPEPPPIALTRTVSPAMADCELSYRQRTGFDIARARAQHRRYEAALAALGCRIVRLPPESALPDSVFVEDAAVVTDELAVITRPGAASRRDETASIAAALERWRELVFIAPPATLDGGDVLLIGKRVWIGLSGRSNREGARQLATALAPFGYAIRAVEVRECLHLKSAVTQVGADTLLINPRRADQTAFGGFRFIPVAPEEPDAANALYLDDRIIYPQSCPWTRDRLERAGVVVHAVDVSEIEKAEGAVTCCSLVFTPRSAEPHPARAVDAGG